MTKVRTVLVVDDEGDFADGIAYLLTAEGLKAKVVTSGHELLAQLEEEKPDLILLDIMMPAFNGLEVLTAIKGNSKNRNLPVILMSASKEPKDHLKYWNDFISKPTNIDELLAKVKTALNCTVA